MASKKPSGNPERPIDASRRRPPATIDLAATEVRDADVRADDIPADDAHAADEADMPPAGTVEPAASARENSTASAPAQPSSEPGEDGQNRNLPGTDLPAVIDALPNAAFYKTKDSPEDDSARHDASIGTPPNEPPELDRPIPILSEPPRAAFSDSPSGSPARAGFPWAIAAAASAIGALALFLALFFAGLIQTQANNTSLADTSGLSTRLAKVESQLSARTGESAEDIKSRGDIVARMDKLEAALETPASPVIDLAMKSRLDALEIAVKSVGDNVAGIAGHSTEVADAARAARAARESSEASAATLSDLKMTLAGLKVVVDQLHGNAIAKSDLDKVTDRVSAVESSTRTVEHKIETPGSTAADRDVRIAVLAAALKDTVERGTPFAAELAAIKPLLGDANAAASLAPFAASGVLSAAALTAEFTLLLPALNAATQTSSRSGGILDRLAASASRLIRVRPLNETQGADPASVLERAEAKSTRGDIAGTVDELAALPANVRAPADSWIARATARNAALAAAQQISAGALDALAKPAQ